MGAEPKYILVTSKDGLKTITLGEYEEQILAYLKEIAENTRKV